MNGIRLTGINLHPVKSTAIRPVDHAVVDRGGLRGDREWMIVTGDGTLLSAREWPSLFRIAADTPATDPSVVGDLRLACDDMDPLTLEHPVAQPIPVTLHRHHLTARPAGDAADGWLQQAAGRADVHLVWCHDPHARALNPAYGRAGDFTAFADGYPVTLLSLTSLTQLNEWVRVEAADRGEPEPDPLPEQRFRQNLVVDGVDEPFAEDGWRRIRVGRVPFRVVKSIDRCVMSTIDPAAMVTSKEPLRSLARRRRWDGKVWFARHLIPDGAGTVRVGDPVTVLE